MLELLLKHNDEDEESELNAEADIDIPAVTEADNAPLQEVIGEKEELLLADTDGDAEVLNEGENE